jgi:hypothetical protein
MKMLILRMWKYFVILFSMVLNVAVVYFPFPYYIHHVGNRLGEDALSVYAFNDIINITDFRIEMTIFGLIGIGLVIISLVFSWLCKRLDMHIIWSIGKICATYSFIILIIIVTLIWIELSYEIRPHYIDLNMGLIFTRSIHILGS